MFKAIPDDYIKEAEKYIVMSVFGGSPFEIGGRIMMQQVVMEQMSVDNIIAIAGMENKEGLQELEQTVCIILVDYTPERIMSFVKKAQKKLGHVIDGLSRMN